MIIPDEDGVYIIAVQDGKFASVRVTNLNSLELMSLRALVLQLERALKEDTPCD